MCRNSQQRVEGTGSWRRTSGPGGKGCDLQMAPQPKESSDRREPPYMQFSPSVMCDSGPWSQGDLALSPEVSPGLTFLRFKMGKMVWI